MRWWIYAALIAGVSDYAGAAEPRPVRVYGYQDALSTEFARGLTQALIVLGGLTRAPEQQPATQLSLLLGRNISVLSGNPRLIRYDIEFRDSDGATLGYISDTCQKVQFTGCFAPVVARARQISDAMPAKR